MATLRIDRIPVADLVVDPANVRTHPERNLEAIKGSLARFGQQKPIVVGKGGVVVAGNGTLEAARALGWEHLDVVRTGLTGADATAFAIADNRTSELAEWDDEGLSRLLSSLPTLEGTGFDQADLDALLASLSPAPPALTDPDDVPEPPAVPVTKPGDLWLLGPHRLLCGDAFDRVARGWLIGERRIDALMTDPPYGISLGTDYTRGGKGNRMRADLHSKDYGRPVEGDDQPFDAAAIRSAVRVSEQFWFGADHYRRTLSEDDRDGSWLVWDKRTEGNAAMWGSKFELCWSAVAHGNEMFRHCWAGTTATNARLGFRREHPTEKPAALLAEILDRWVAQAGAVLDLFAGSGTTLIAAHLTGRTAYLIEIDPLYCDVICRRYQEHTGTVPILEATGEPHDFTERADAA